MKSDKWDKRMLELAQHVAGWSKDPSTKVGVVIADDRNRIVSLGYNGFPRGVEDHPDLLEDRTHKYPRVVHAELNAILNAGRSVDGCTLYVWPLAPCADCAGAIIQAGLKRVVIPFGVDSAGSKRWAEANAVAFDMLSQAGVRIYAI